MAKFSSWDLLLWQTSSIPHSWVSIKNYVMGSWNIKFGMGAVESFSFNLIPDFLKNFSEPSYNDLLWFKINDVTKALLRISSLNRGNSEGGQSLAIKSNGLMIEMRREYLYIRGKKRVDYVEDLILEKYLPNFTDEATLVYETVYSSGKTHDGKDFQKQKARSDLVFNGFTPMDIIKKVSDEYDEQFFIDYSGYTGVNKKIVFVLEPQWTKREELVGINNYFIYNKNIFSDKIQKSTKDFANKIVLNWGTNENPKTIIEQDDVSIAEMKLLDGKGVFEHYEKKEFDDGEGAIQYAHQLLVNKTQSLWSGNIDVVYDDKIDFTKLANVTDLRIGLNGEIFRIKNMTVSYSDGGIKCSISLDNFIPTIGEVFAKKIGEMEKKEVKDLILDIPFFLKDKIQIKLGSFSVGVFPEEDYMDTWTKRIEMNVLPENESDVWTYSGNTESQYHYVDNGILFNITDPTVSQYSYWKKSWGANNSNGSIVETKIKVISGNQDIMVADGVGVIRLRFKTDRVSIINREDIMMNTTDGYHKYRFKIWGDGTLANSHYELWIDNLLKSSGSPEDANNVNEIRFGDESSIINYGGDFRWDYIYYNLSKNLGKVRVGRFDIDDYSTTEHPVYYEE